MKDLTNKVVIFSNDGNGGRYTYVSRLSTEDSTRDFRIGTASFRVVDIISGIEEDGYAQINNMILSHPFETNVVLKYDAKSNYFIEHNI